MVNPLILNGLAAMFMDLAVVPDVELKPAGKKRRTATPISLNAQAEAEYTSAMETSAVETSAVGDAVAVNTDDYNPPCASTATVAQLQKLSATGAAGARAAVLGKSTGAVGFRTPQ